MQHLLDSKTVTNVSEEPTASIFMIKEYGECGKKWYTYREGEQLGNKENSLKNIKPFKGLFSQGRVTGRNTD
jgi:hypothetical protein